MYSLWGSLYVNPSPTYSFHATNIIVQYYQSTLLHTFFVSSFSYSPFPLTSQNRFLLCDLCQEILQFVICSMKNWTRGCFSLRMLSVLYLKEFCLNSPPVFFSFSQELNPPPPSKHNPSFFFVFFFVNFVDVNIFLFWASLTVFPIFSLHKQRDNDLWVIL